MTVAGLVLFVLTICMAVSLYREKYDGRPIKLIIAVLTFFIGVPVLLMASCTLILGGGPP